MPEITFTGPILIEQDGTTRQLTAEDIRGAKGDKGEPGDKGNKGDKGEQGEFLVCADGGTASSVSFAAGLDGGNATWP